MGDSKPAPGRKPTRRRLSCADRNEIALCRRWLGRCTNSKRLGCSFETSVASLPNCPIHRRGSAIGNNFRWRSDRVHYRDHVRATSAGICGSLLMIGEQRPFLFSLFTSIRRPSCASLVLDARPLPLLLSLAWPLTARRAAAPNRSIIGTCEALHFAW